MTTEKQIETGIFEIVGVFTDPIIVMPGGWGDTLPEWLKAAITLERLIENIKVIKGEEMTGTDAEACAYLMTVSLTQPMDSNWIQIYLYIATQTYRRHNKHEMHANVAVNTLNDYQRGELNRFKTWLYHTRTKARQERERVDKRQGKEAEVAKQKAEHPALFEF